MAWLVCGSVPDTSFPLCQAVWHYEAQRGVLVADNLPDLAVERGTATLLCACVCGCRALGVSAPEALLVGDVGDGDGSRALYMRLSRDLANGALHKGITFHYLYPDIDGQNRILASLEDRGEGGLPRPLLVADAGYMYAAKMSGYAQSYDLFTPDVGELAFLADETAPHPLYTRGFLLASEKDVPGLVERACRTGNAAQNLLVKGKSDTIVLNGRIRATVSEPQTPALEAIGGTGDLVAGLVSAMLHAGMMMEQACLVAARAARLAGSLAKPTPATQIAAIMPQVEEAVHRVLAQ